MTSGVVTSSVDDSVGEDDGAVEVEMATVTGSAVTVESAKGTKKF